MESDRSEFEEAGDKGAQEAEDDGVESLIRTVSFCPFWRYATSSSFNGKLGRSCKKYSKVKLFGFKARAEHTRMSRNGNVVVPNTGTKMLMNMCRVSSSGAGGAVAVMTLRISVMLAPAAILIGTALGRSALFAVGRWGDKRVVPSEAAEWAVTSSGWMSNSFIPNKDTQRTPLQVNCVGDSNRIVFVFFPGVQVALVPPDISSLCVLNDPVSSATEPPPP